ncbi:MAG: 4-hydroxy-tetrahydrodipicolinate reductase [Verrucomicrobia bacterium]|nr:4-hydroxy-tetrahydrodipicolinate reductase [Verrucomicrobiota bacterium]
MTRVLVHGATGRLGSLIVKLAQADAELAVRPASRSTPLAPLLPDCDVAVDVSQPAGTLRVLEAATASGVPVVIGTTGHSPPELARIDEAARKIAVLLAPNFSVAVNLLFWLTRHAARALGEPFRAEILELHHELKKDAPSGTAKRLGEIVAEARGQEYDRVVRHGRHGALESRGSDELGMHAIRAGDIVGEHTVFLIGPAERLELTHRAASREIFARGALRAARWLVSRRPGCYDMADVLSLPG